MLTRIGTLTVGDGPAVVIAQVGEPDARWLSLRPHHGALTAVEAIRDATSTWAGPLLVEPFSAADLPAIRAHADGVVIGAAWMQDYQLVRAVARQGLPVIIQRGPAATLDEWLAIAEYCAVEGNDQVVLCESGTRVEADRLTLDLALMREARRRTGRPVLVDLGADAALAAAAVGAGADGLLLTDDSTAVAQAHEAVVVVGALVRRTRPGTVLAARAAIDRVDAALATLLERRVNLAGTIQELKPVGGFAGRDADRERRVVAQMARRAPRLGETRLRRIMTAVIEAGLELHDGVSTRRNVGGPR